MVKNHPEFRDPLVFIKKIHEQHGAHHKLTPRGIETGKRTLYLFVVALIDLIEKRIYLKEIPDWIIVMIRDLKLESEFYILLE